MNDSCDYKFITIADYKYKYNSYLIIIKDRVNLE